MHLIHRMTDMGLQQRGLRATTPPHSVQGEASRPSHTHSGSRSPRSGSSHGCSVSTARPWPHSGWSAGTRHRGRHINGSRENPEISVTPGNHRWIVSRHNTRLGSKTGLLSRCLWASQVGLEGKNLLANAGDVRDAGV